MNRAKVRVAMMLWLTLGTGLSLPATGAEENAEPILGHGKLKLKNDLVWEVEDLRRAGRKFITLRRKEDAGTIQIAVADVAYLEFAVELEDLAVDRLYQAGEFQKLGDVLESRLLHLFSFLDVPNNMHPEVPMILKCAYRQGDYPKLRELCDEIQVWQKRGPLFVESMLYEALAYWEQGEAYPLERQMKNLPELTRGSPVLPIDSFLRAQLLIEDEKWDEARVFVHRMVAFSGRDFEWMPAGLYLSVRCYLNEGAYAVSKQVVEEMKTAYPSSRWTTLAEEVLAAAPPPEATGEEASAEGDAPEKPAAPPGKILVQAESYSRRTDGSDHAGKGSFRWWIIPEEQAASAPCTAATGDDEQYLQPLPSDEYAAPAAGRLAGPRLAKVEFDLELPAPGVYRVAVRVAGTVPDATSLYVEIPGVSPVDPPETTPEQPNPNVLSVAANATGVFAWQVVGRWDLSAGVQVVRVLLCDQAVGLDAVRMERIDSP